MISGDQLKTVRQMHYRMTQAEFAELLNVSLRTIGNWERDGVPETREHVVTSVVPAEILAGRNRPWEGVPIEVEPGVYEGIEYSSDDCTVIQDGDVFQVSFLVTPEFTTTDILSGNDLIEVAAQAREAFVHKLRERKIKVIRNRSWAQNRALTWGDMSGVNWGDLEGLTFEDMTRPKWVEELEESEVPFTRAAAFDAARHGHPQNADEDEANQLEP